MEPVLYWGFQSVITRNDPHQSPTDQPIHRSFSPVHLPMYIQRKKKKKKNIASDGSKMLSAYDKKKKQTEAARRSRHRSTSSNDLFIRNDILRYPHRPNSDLNVCLITVTMYSLYIRPLDIQKRRCWNYSHYSKPQYFTRTCDNLSRKCFLLFRLTYRDARPRDDGNRKYFMEFAPFTRFLHWFTIFHPIFLCKPNWSSFFINKKLKCVNAEWRSCNVWINREKHKVLYSTSAFPLYAYVSRHVASIRLVVIYV